jgi:Putative Zn-dependent protease, contains TPR repeats
MNENKVFHAILAVIPIIIIYIMDLDRLLQLVLSMAVSLAVYFIFAKINNRDKKLYFITVIIIIFLFTALNSILNQNYSLSYILPSFAGVIMALYYISNWKDYVSKWEIAISIKKSNNLIKDGKIEEAVPYFDNILKLDPQNFLALNNNAVAFNKIGKYAESMELADKILKKDPENDFAMNIKSKSLIKLEKYDEAMEIIDKVLKENSKNGIALANKATALSNRVIIRIQ